MTQNKLTRNNIILLICLLIIVLFHQLLFVHSRLILKIIFTAIILSGTFSLEFKKRTRNILITCGTVTIFLIWLNYFIISDWLKMTMFFSFFCFNLFTGFHRPFIVISVIFPGINPSMILFIPVLNGI